MNKRIEIKLNKKMLLFSFIGGIVFVIIGIKFTIDPENHVSHKMSSRYSLIFKNPSQIRMLGIIVVLFFGAVVIVVMKKLFDNKPGLIIDENGITDNSSGLSIGLIEWADIKDISSTKVGSNNFIMINVANPEIYIKKATNKVKVSAMRMNMDLYGTPFFLTSSALKYSFDKLEELLLTEFKRSENLENSPIDPLIELND